MRLANKEFSIFWTGLFSKSGISNFLTSNKTEITLSVISNLYSANESIFLSFYLSNVVLRGFDYESKNLSVLYVFYEFQVLLVWTRKDTDLYSADIQGTQRE